MTYTRWFTRAAAVADGLSRLNVKPGDRILLPCDQNRMLDYATAYVGVQICGGVAVPVLSGMGEQHIAGVFHRSRAIGTIADFHIEGGWSHSLAALSPDVPTSEPEILARPDHIAEILYTSGTTGEPKGVEVRHDNLLATLAGDPAKPPTKVLHAIPPAFNAGQALMLQTLNTAPHTSYILGEFRPADFLDAVDAVRPHHVVLLPSQADALLRHGYTGPPFRSVSLIRCVSAPVSGLTLSALASIFPNAARTSVYMSTESAPSAITIEFDPTRPDTIGKPRGRTSLLIADPDLLKRDPPELQELPPDNLGEVLLRASDAPPRAYADDPKATRRVFLPGGWVRTGDIGSVDSHGFLSLSDRISDVVLKGGLNISTLEVTRTAKEFATVLDAAGFGLPHPTLGHVMALAVVGEIDLAELDKFLQHRLGPRKAPTVVRSVSAIPRNTLGKALNNDLRALFAEIDANTPLPVVDPDILSLARELWSEAFPTQEISDRVSFINLGGESWHAGDMAVKVAKHLNLEIQPLDAYRSPNVHEFAAVLADAPPANYTPIQRVDRSQSWEN
jgi:acyl-CoA synthetase (AMP-forming)/AMP-acid ligase II